MIVECSQVLRAFVERWELDATLVQLVPGGVHDGRVPEKVDGKPVKTPYASIEVEEGEIEYSSGAPYWQKFPTTVRVWSTAGPIDAAAIRRALDRVFDRDRALTEMAIGGATIMSLEPLPSALREDPATKDARDVMLTERNWSLWVFAKR